MGSTRSPRRCQPDAARFQDKPKSVEERRNKLASTPKTSLDGTNNQHLPNNHTNTLSEMAAGHSKMNHVTMEGWIETRRTMKQSWRTHQDWQGIRNVAPQSESSPHNRRISYWAREPFSTMQRQQARTYATK